jgi:hypothetical protein
LEAPIEAEGAGGVEDHCATVNYISVVSDWGGKVRFYWKEVSAGSRRLTQAELAATMWRGRLPPRGSKEMIVHLRPLSTPSSRVVALLGCRTTAYFRQVGKHEENASGYGVEKRAPKQIR